MASQRAMAQGPYDQPKHSPLHKGLLNIKNEIDRILQKMKKDPKFLPNQEELNEFSSQVLQLIDKYHPRITPEQRKLLTAVIDLNEVPLMHPSMQRISFEVALKDASQNIEQYLITNP
jgi:hypothetical protein